MANLTLSWGLVSVPVAMLPLARDTSLKGRQLCPEHMQPVKRGTLVCSVDGHDVEQHVIGYELPDGSFAEVERDSLRSERTGVVELGDAVDVGAIDPLYFEKTYYLQPKKGGEASHDVLASALHEDGRALLGKVVLAKTTRPLVVRWSEAAGCLVGHICTFDANIRWTELRGVAATTKTRTVNDKQVGIAKQLLEANAGEFEPHTFVDDYGQRLQAAVDAAAEGRPMVEPELPEPAAPVADLMDALQASLAEAQRSKKAAKNGVKPLTKKQLAEKNALAPAHVKEASVSPRKRRPKKVA